MKFACRTRGNAAPQGKPRVFLTGHPADLPACSEDIFTDILNIQDCAVYYDEESDAPCDKEALLQELEQMQARERKWIVAETVLKIVRRSDCPAAKALLREMEKTMGEAAP